jgi:endonuclease/exonuclease/phosphatase family metal-dependent hydrolase
MSYNLLNYPGTDAAIRNPYFRTVIRNSNPDILVVQEMQSQAGMNGFLSNVLNASGNNYSAGTFIDGPDTDNGIFFRTSKFIFISSTPIRTALRDISEFKVIHINYPADTLHIFSVHLKASEGTANENLRAAEADSLRKVTNALHPNALYIVLGDFNIYRSGEPAYIKLLEINQNNTGHFIDPIQGMAGTWNNPSYAVYHTQSPRVRAFGGGATGGMDDRFDMILMSPVISSTNGGIIFIPGSYTPYGNDGAHYNDSINRRPNNAVPDSVADALHYSSDHIPVFAMFRFGNTIGINITSNEIPNNFSLKQNYPNPFNPSTTIRFDIAPSGRARQSIRLAVYDIIGNQVAVIVSEPLSPGSYEASWDASGFTSGVYFYRLETEYYSETRKMILIK